MCLDLGADNGVFSRAEIGPFASSEEAYQFCSELKAAGGQCLSREIEPGLLDRSRGCR